MTIDQIIGMAFGAVAVGVSAWGLLVLAWYIRYGAIRLFSLAVNRSTGWGVVYALSWGFLLPFMAAACAIVGFIGLVVYRETDPWKGMD